MRRIVVKEKASIAALSSLIASEVAGKPLSRALRSHGSMLLFDFGRLIKTPDSRKRYLFRGEWTLLIEWSDWAITAPGASRITSDSEQALIDNILPTLVKQPIKDLAFNARGTIALRLQNGASFIGSGEGGPRKSSLSLWTLLSEVNWSLAFSCSRRFVVYSENSARQTG
jgi:hypothetical protein